jgi:hypothetical protein
MSKIAEPSLFKKTAHPSPSPCRSDLPVAKISQAGACSYRSLKGKRELSDFEGKRLTSPFFSKNSLIGNKGER